MAFPQIGSAQFVANSPNTTSHTATYPADIAEGDLLILGAAFDGVVGIDGTTMPSGWNNIAGTFSGTAVYGDAWYKIALGTESGSFTFGLTLGANETSAIYMVRIPAASWHGTTPPEGTTATGADANPNPPTITASWGSADNLFISIFAQDGGDGDSATASTYPTSYADNQFTQLSATGNGQCGIAFCTRELASDSDDPGTFTSNRSDSWTALTIVVRPSAGSSSSSRSSSSRSSSVSSSSRSSSSSSSSRSSSSSSSSQSSSSSSSSRSSSSSSKSSSSSSRSSSSSSSSRSSSSSSSSRSSSSKSSSSSSRSSSSSSSSSSESSSSSSSSRSSSSSSSSRSSSSRSSSSEVGVGSSSSSRSSSSRSSSSSSSSSRSSSSSSRSSSSSSSRSSSSLAVASSSSSSQSSSSGAQLLWRRIGKAWIYNASDFGSGVQFGLVAELKSIGGSPISVRMVDQMYEQEVDIDFRCSTASTTKIVVQSAGGIIPSQLVDGTIYIFQGGSVSNDSGVVYSVDLTG